MILADSSVWIDHLRAPLPELDGLLAGGRLLAHALVVAEIALGSIRNRGRVLAELQDLRSVPEARLSEIRTLIETHGLHGRGIGYVDTALLASCLLAPGTQLWTRDKRLATVADQLGVAWPLAR